MMSTVSWRSGRKEDRFQTALELARAFAAAIADGLSADVRTGADELISRARWGRFDRGAPSR